MMIFWLIVCLHMAIQYPKIQDYSVCGSILLLFTALPMQCTQNALKNIFSKTHFLKVEQP